MLPRRVAGGSYALREPDPGDVDSLLPIKNDPEVAALLAGTTHAWSRSDLLDWVAHHQTAPNEAFFVIADDTDRAVGHAALYRIDTSAGSAEFGILLGDKSVWGKGIGSQVTRSVIDYGFETLGLRRIYLEVLETNERAKRVYEKLGFRVEGRLRQHQFKDGKPIDVVVMGLLRDEYRPVAQEPAPA